MDEIKKKIIIIMKGTHVSVLCSVCCPLFLFLLKKCFVFPPELDDVMLLLF